MIVVTSKSSIAKPAPLSDGGTVFVENEVDGELDEPVKQQERPGSGGRKI